MPAASALLHSATRRQLDHYHCVFAGLEDAFNAYEAGQISISGYADVIGDLTKAVEEQRAAWLRLCDGVVALRWINRAERTAYLDTLAALDWCRAWAQFQRGAHVTAGLEQACAAGAAGEGTESGAASWRMAA